LFHPTDPMRLTMPNDQRVGWQVHRRRSTRGRKQVGPQAPAREPGNPLQQQDPQPRAEVLHVRAFFPWVLCHVNIRKAQQWKSGPKACA
jgi:hypothetical protein